ncbi:MAG: OmpA family protein [Gammaproteobacteria bacterium]|nr:OmpA family protein [Gammaproteobacteria bacterium]
MRRILVAIIVVMCASTARAAPEFPTSQLAWARALARPEYKGQDPCARSKGICVEAGFQPMAAALVHFDVDSTRIRSAHNAALDELGQALRDQLSDAVLLIQGHADSTGPRAYNQALSERRARAVRDFLIERFALDPVRLQVEGKGEDVPIASNRTAAGRQLNRRVVFVRVGTVIR